MTSSLTYHSGLPFSSVLTVRGAPHRYPLGVTKHCEFGVVDNIHGIPAVQARRASERRGGRVRVEEEQKQKRRDAEAVEKRCLTSTLAALCAQV